MATHRTEYRNLSYLKKKEYHEHKPFWSRKFKGRKHIGRHRLRGEDNIKMELEIGDRNWTG
jgi:hypothetical protein